MSKYSIDEIAQKLTPGYVIKHADGHNLKVVSLEKCDDTDYYVNVLIGKKEDIYSLKFLLDKALILNEDLGLNFPIKVDELKLSADKVPLEETPVFIKEPVCPPHKEVKKEETPKNLVKSYSELFSLMEKGDSSVSRYCRYFWHITNSKNLVEIVKTGAFRSRYDIEGNIPFDNKIRNETSKEVMASNFSYLTERHVRFYLRPLNKAFFRMLYNDSGQVKNDLTVVSINREALFKSRYSTFLYPGNAHRAVDDDFDMKHKLNLKFKNSFPVNHLDKFDFDVIYSKYEVEQSEEVKRLQQAEFLVWKELSISYIHKIFFQNDAALNRFLSAIGPLAVYNEIKDKCEVNSDIFNRYN